MSYKCHNNNQIVFYRNKRKCHLVIDTLLLCESFSDKTSLVSFHVAYRIHISFKYLFATNGFCAILQWDKILTVIVELISPFIRSINFGELVFCKA